MTTENKPAHHADEPGPAGAASRGEPNLWLVPLPGSERGVPRRAPAWSAAPVDEATTVEATVVLRRRAPLPGHVLTGRGLSQAAFAQQYGADPGDLHTVTTRFEELGLAIVSVDAGSRRVRISGDVRTVQRVFGTSLQAEGDGRRRTGGLSVPGELDGVVTAVLGLDNRPQSRALYRPVPAAAVSVSYTPLDLAKIYDFPTGVDGSGQTVAIIELGGGFARTDLDAYFGGLGMATPSVTAVGVDGATNVAGQDPTGADGEVLLDIEVAGALAPGAQFLVYFAPSSDDGFLDAVSQAAHATPTPAAISISWGGGENEWTAQGRQAMDEAFADACALGITVTAAAGDDGSSDREKDGKAHVDFPAASPHALACGGTKLAADPQTGVVTSETVWNEGPGSATGGGYSVTFARPAYQAAIGTPAPIAAGGVDAGSSTEGSSSQSGDVPSGDLHGDLADDAVIAAGTGRGVPDVAAVADPRTGYRVLVDGEQVVVGGTSAVAPLWAALVARLAQAQGHGFGLIQPLLYPQESSFRDITEGNNGAYSAGPGWDPCTGLGVPDATKLVSALTKPS